MITWSYGLLCKSCLILNGPLLFLDETLWLIFTMLWRDSHSKKLFFTWLYPGLDVVLTITLARWKLNECRCYSVGVFKCQLTVIQKLYWLFMVSCLTSLGGTSWTVGKRKPENSRTSWNVWRSKILACSNDLLMVFWLLNLLPIKGIGIRELKQQQRQQHWKCHLKKKHLRNGDYFVIITSSFNPLLLTEHAANELVEAPLK